MDKNIELLGIAVREGNLDEIRDLVINKGTNVEGNENNALFEAISCANMEVIKLLIGLGQRILIEEDGPLKDAMNLNRREITEFFLEIGNYQGRNPQLELNAFCAIGNYDQAEDRILTLGPSPDYHIEDALPLACKNNHKEVVELLLRNFPDQKESYPQALANSCKADATEITQILLNIGVDPNPPDGRPLIEAASAGCEKTIKLLLQNGADIRTNNDDALYYALMHSHFEVIKTLIKNYPIEGLRQLSKADQFPEDMLLEEIQRRTTQKVSQIKELETPLQL